MTHDLEALAARVEAAGGADRELDAEIALLIGYARCRRPTADSNHRLPLENQYGHGFYPPAYLSCLDAAMSLVPKGSRWSVEWESIDSVWATVSVPLNDGWWSDEGRIFAATPALALTAAALRAIAATTSETTRG